MPRFSANLTFLFNELPFLERFDAAARAGFRGVEFLSPYDFRAEDVAGAAAAAGLEVILFNAAIGDFAGGERGLAALPGREHEFAADVAKALHYADVLGCRRLHVMAGLLPENADAGARARYRRTYIANLRIAAEEARAKGIELLIEPINLRDIPRYFLNHQAEGHAIREEIGAANLKVQMDFYHCQIVEGDLTEKFRRWQAGIGHVQVANVPGRHEPDRGEIDYGHIFRMLDEQRYAGWVGCEYKPAGDTVEGLGWMYRLIGRK